MSISSLPNPLLWLSVNALGPDMTNYLIESLEHFEKHFSLRQYLLGNSNSLSSRNRRVLTKVQCTYSLRVCVDKRLVDVSSSQFHSFSDNSRVLYIIRKFSGLKIGTSLQRISHKFLQSVFAIRRSNITNGWPET